MKKIIFDVDGTLTPSRGTIDTEFKQWFNNFCRKNQVFLVTGSDKSKTVEQLGEDTYNLCHTVYNCNGNDVWQSSKHIHTNNWTVPSIVCEWLSERLQSSAFPIRTGNHFEQRPGMINFSIVGRNANQEERKEYIKYDIERKERESIARDFNNIFPYLVAKIGGETGLDINPQGADKSQIVKRFFNNDILHFFGDAMYDGGNDQPLAKLIIDKNKGFCYHVKDWKHTWQLLKENYDN